MKTVTIDAIGTLVKKWRYRLGFDDRWDIDVRLCTSEELWPHGDVVAVAEAEPGYFRGTISVNKEAAERDGDSLEHIVLHELCHFVTWPVRLVVFNALGEAHKDTASSMDEAVVETFTRALLANNGRYKK